MLRALCLACSKLCYIRCAECKPDVDVCVGCFFAGQEPGEHKKTHKYRVMDKLNKPIFSGTYVHSSRRRLLPAIGAGVGN